jgi:protein TonB
MRRILAASVLLTPLFISAAALASQPVTDASASTTTRPLSTGVTPARVVYSTNVDLTPAAKQSLPYNAEVVVKMNVDENGKAQSVQVIKSPSPSLDIPVVAAVRQFKFQPAMLDYQPVATNLTLTLVLAH